MSPKVDWYYDRVRDVVVVTTTTTTQTLLYYGRLNNLAKIPPIPTFVDLPEFLWPPSVMPRHEGMHEVEPILEPAPLPEYIHLPDLQLMSLYLPPLEPIIPKVVIIDISSSNSLAPAVQHRQSSDAMESDPSEELSIAVAKFLNVVLGAYVLLVCVGSTPPTIPRGHHRRGRGLRVVAIKSQQVGGSFWIFSNCRSQLWNDYLKCIFYF